MAKEHRGKGGTVEREGSEKPLEHGEKRKKNFARFPGIRIRGRSKENNQKLLKGSPVIKQRGKQQSRRRGDVSHHDNSSRASWPEGKEGLRSIIGN